MAAVAAVFALAPAVVVVASVAVVVGEPYFHCHFQVVPGGRHSRYPAAAVVDAAAVVAVVVVAAAAVVGCFCCSVGCFDGCSSRDASAKMSRLFILSGITILLFLKMHNIIM